MVQTTVFTVFRSLFFFVWTMDCNHVFSGLLEATLIRSSRQFCPMHSKSSFLMWQDKKGKKKSSNQKWGPISESLWGHVCTAFWSPANVFLMEAGVDWWWHKGPLRGNCQLLLRWQDQFRKTNKQTKTDTISSLLPTFSTCRNVWITSTAFRCLLWK